MIYHYDAPPRDIHKPDSETQQLEREAIDWCFVALGTAVYIGLVLLTLWWLP